MNNSVKTCRYCVDNSNEAASKWFRGSRQTQFVWLRQAPGTFSVIEPPPYTVVKNVRPDFRGKIAENAPLNQTRGVSQPVDRISPASIEVEVWACPNCSYMELHYK